SDDLFSLQAMAVGNRCSDSKIFYAQIARKSHLKRCQKDHEERYSFPTTKLLELYVEVSREREFHCSAPMGQHWRTWKVSWQYYFCNFSELFFPVFQLLMHRPALEPPALP